MTAVLINAPLYVENGSDRFPLEPEQSWKREGSCLGLGSKANKIFFPEKGASAREAKVICSTCPVLEQCRDYALNGREKFGVWGGMNEKDRKNYKRKMQREAAKKRGNK